MSKIKVHDDLILDPGSASFTHVKGPLVATKFYGDGSQLTNLPSTAAIGASIPPADGTNEGGELTLEGAGTWDNAIVDLYKDRFRIHLGPSADVKFNVGADGQLGIGPGFWDEADHTVHAKGVLMPEIVSHETTNGEKTRMTSFAGEGFVGTLGTGALHIHSGNTFAMNIFNSGEVQMPFQPAFQADGNNIVNGALTSGTAYDDPIICDNAIVNIGNNYDVVTGLFTAPITGTYFFHALVQHNKWEANDWHAVAFYVNGTGLGHEYSASAKSTVASAAASEAEVTSHSPTITWPMAAGDTMEIRNKSWELTHTYRVNWGGHLIG